MDVRRRRGSSAGRKRGRGAQQQETQPHVRRRHCSFAVHMTTDHHRSRCHAASRSVRRAGLSYATARAPHRSSSYDNYHRCTIFQFSVRLENNILTTGLWPRILSRNRARLIALEYQPREKSDTVDGFNRCVYVYVCVCMRMYVCVCVFFVYIFKSKQYFFYYFQFFLHGFHENEGDHEGKRSETNETRARG